MLRSGEKFFRNFSENSVQRRSERIENDLRVEVYKSFNYKEL
jgi:hypothetical protein